MLSDPIAALATPPGRSALAVVRLSGAGAFAVAARVVPGFSPEPPRRATLAAFRAADGSPVDRGLYTAFPAPHSYTGEDLVEFSCHGGLVAPSRLLTALHAAGARPAQPGEFTRRAVLNGKLDLLGAEAVGDLIDAAAPAQARAALHQLEGHLSRRIHQLREALLDLEALLSYDIDFPGEDDGPVSGERIAAGLDAVAERVDRLLATAATGERVRAGALVVLAGRVNAGKSSLFNALLGADRVLVSETPGTTRDTVEAGTDLRGWPVRLADTAGLMDSADPVDRLGIAMSRRYIEGADLVLLCVEASRPPDVEEAVLAADPRALLVRTKTDLGPVTGAGIPVSVLSGEGLDTVRDAVARRLFGDRAALADLEPVLTRERHRVALTRARDALNVAREHLAPGSDAVLLAHHVREAVTALDELIGVVDVEEVLGRLFAGFCVGK